MLGGADISWIVSLLVTSLVYYPLAKRSMKVPAAMIYPKCSPAPAVEPDFYAEATRFRAEP